MRPAYTLVVLFSLVGLNLSAKNQDVKVDSLKQLVGPALKDPHKTPDTLTISRIDKLATGYFESKPDSAWYYGDLEIKLSKKINYQKGIADGLSQLAEVNTFHGDFTTSGQNFNAALNIYTRINDVHGICASYLGLGYIQDYLGNYTAAINLYDKALKLSLRAGGEEDESACYNLMGITYDNKGDFSKALDCYFKALFIDIKRKDDLASANKYSNIGVIMHELELYPKALNYYNKALVIWEKAGDQQGISTAYQNIGETLIAQKQYQQAIGYLRKASVMFQQLNDSDGISLVYYDLGLYNYNTNHTDSAVYYLNLSLQTSTKSKIRYNKANAYIGLAKVYNLEKNYPQAYSYASQAARMGQDLTSLSIQTEAALQASKALAGLKRFEEAYHQHEQYSNLKSDLKHNESINKIVLYNLEIDLNKKQRDLAKGQHQKEQVYLEKIATQKSQILVYAGLVVLLAILAVVYYKGKRKQKTINELLVEKNKEIELQKASLNDQATKLNELNTLKDRLISVLAHDLRAPISTLRGLFNLLIDDAVSPEEFVDMVPKVFKTLEHTSDFLDTLLFWINSQVGKSDIKIKNFLLDDIVQRELAHLEDKLRQKNITVQTDVAPDTVVLGDPNSVRIVIHNFLTNAIKFSNRDGRINVSAGLQATEGIQFSVSDKGIGMTNDRLGTLFKNQLVSNPGTDNEGGTGMGLLFCKDLIQKQKGTIWATSTLGIGTELCFTLPAGDVAEVL